MKFVPVSIFFAVASPVAGSDTTNHLVLDPLAKYIAKGGDEGKRRENSFKTYLKTVFPSKSKDDDWLERAVENLGEGDTSEHHNMRNAEWMCWNVAVQVGTRPNKWQKKLKVPASYKGDDGPKQKDALANKKYYGSKEDDNEKWCCSDRLKLTLKNKEDVKCDCKHKGEPTSENAGLDCCSQMAEVKDGVTVCKGIPPYGLNQPFVNDDYGYFKLDVSDCMYPSGGELKEMTARAQKKTTKGFNMQKCGPRKCQRWGNKPDKTRDVCCGGANQSWDRPEDNKSEACGCTPYMVKQSKFWTGQASDCCSKNYVHVEEKQCGCIPDNMERPPDASASDCCSGHDLKREGKHWCKVDGCTPQGQQITENGQECCAHNTTKIRYEVNKPCGCVPGGVQPYKDVASRCCSSVTYNNTKKCAFIETKGDVKTWFNESECFSGKKDENSKCKCMEPFSTNKSVDLIKQHPDQCCSGYVIDDDKSKHNGRCGCIKTGDRLGFGSDESHCCSGTALDGICQCIPPGGKFSGAEGMTSADCCSSLSGEHFCLCNKKNTTARNDACCGDVEGKTCKCIPDGHLIPTSEKENPDNVCCSKTSGQHCSSTSTCGSSK